MEENKQKLNDHFTFEPYALFSRIDRDDKKYITRDDLILFLADNNVTIDSNRSTVDLFIEYYDRDLVDKVVVIDHHRRGALFMIDLKEIVEKAGGTVVHIKTDSIKVVDPSKDIVDLIMSTGKKYGYDFEVEHIFERFCLVNNAVYVAKLAAEWCWWECRSICWNCDRSASGWST